MKSKFYFLALLFLSTYHSFAQSPITISGTCDEPDALGVYNYDGDVDGKPSYRKGDLVDCIPIPTEPDCTAIVDSFVYYIRWSNALNWWEWVAEPVGCLWIVQICVPNNNSPTYLAISSENTSLPTCDGWAQYPGQPSGCSMPNISGCESLSIIQNTFSNAVVLYPNPTSGNVSIDLGNSNKSINVRLMNLIGEVIWIKEFNNASSFHFKIDDQPSGMYFVDVTGAKGEKAYLKVVKK